MKVYKQITADYETDEQARLALHTENHQGGPF